MLLIGNGRVLTRDKSAPYYPDGAVLIDGEQIRAVGDRRELQNQYPDAEWIDACGGVIMPGLINTHTHIYSGLARGLSIKGNNPRSFPEILEGTWWNIDRHLTPDGTKACAYATILECIRNGVTTIFDHHASFGQVQGSLFTIRDAAKELGMRACLCYEVSERDAGRGGEMQREHPGERGLCPLVQGRGRRHDPGHVRRARALYHLGQDLRGYGQGQRRHDRLSHPCGRGDGRRL